MIHAHSQAFPSVGLSVHVDDIIRDFHGSHDTQVVSQVMASNQLVRQHFRELCMPLAKDKEQVVATTLSLAKAVSKASLGKGTTAEHSVRRLGCDFALNDKSGHPHLVHQNRIRQTRRRLTHMAKRFRKHKPRLIYQAGVQPAATFGADVHGLSAEAVQVLLKGARQVSTVQPMGVPTTMILYAWQTASRPDFVAATAPIVRYAREIWMSAGPGHLYAHGDELTAVEIRKVFGRFQTSALMQIPIPGIMGHLQTALHDLG
jgi:hypothetical protein